MNQNQVGLLTKKMYLIGVFFIILLLVVYWFFTHSFLSVRVTPKDAIVTLNNAPIRLNSRGKLNKTISPGRYNLQIEADGYNAFIENFTVKGSRKKSYTVNLTETPTPVSIDEHGKFITKDAEFNTFDYLGDNGKTLYKIKLGLNDKGDIEVKSKSRLTDPKLSGISEIVWSPNKDLALFRKEDGVYLFDFKRYDFINQTETKWGSDIGSIAWAPDNSKIAYYYAPANGEKSLIFSNLENTEVTRIVNLAEMDIENPILKWSQDSEWLLIIPRSTNWSKNKLYLVNAYSRTIKPITDTGDQLDAVFTLDNNSIIYSTYSKSLSSPVKAILSIMNRDGSNTRSLDLRAEIGKVSPAKDGRALTVATFNDKTQQDSVFMFNTETKEKMDFSITNLDFGFINLLLNSDDGKMVIYESDRGIFAVETGK